MKIAIITDAWHPQINGVVTTMSMVIKHLEAFGHEIKIIEPSMFWTVPLPSYPEIKLSLNVWKVGSMIRQFNPDAIHIVTEGSLGLAAMLYCRRKNFQYTSSFHTRFPEYIQQRLPFIPASFGYSLIRFFHKKSEHVFVPTENVSKELNEMGLNNTLTWSRGVDTTNFYPLQEDEKGPLDYIDEPILLCVTRVAVEKNIECFLQTKAAGKKVIVGDGPMRKKLEKKYPDALFVGYKTGRELAQYFASADVFVFPSLTDTFGVVMLEAMACGTPIAAFDVTGPNNVIIQNKTGFMSKDYTPQALTHAINEAIQLDRQDCIEFAHQNTWEATSQFFVDHLSLLKPSKEKSVYTAEQTS